MNIRHFVKTAAASTVALALSTQFLMGETTLSNLDQTDDGWIIPVGLSFYGSSLGQAFTVSGDWRLASVTLGLVGSNTSGTEPAGEFSISIYSGAISGLPSVKLATLVGNSNPYAAGLYTYTATDGVLLTSGVQYWIVTSVPNYGEDFGYDFRAAEGFNTALPGWSVSETGSLLFSSDGFATGDSYDSAYFGGNIAFAIDAEAVPEPSTVVVLALGGAGLFEALRRQRSAKAVG